MISNNKVSSFYPSAKKPLNNFVNPNLRIIGNQNLINKGHSINNNHTNDSVELALITVNLSLPRFKSMNRGELDNYVKTMAYNNSFDSKKYMLSLNILLNEHDRLQQDNITKQIIHMEETKPKSAMEQKVNLNNYDARQMAYIEPDEFKLNTQPQQIQPQNPFSIINIIKNDDSSNVTNNFSIKQNKNLEMSTYSGNPFGIVKITNSQPGNSLRPLNSVSRNNDNSTKYSIVDNMTDMSYNDNLTNRTTMVNKTNQNSVVKQTSFTQNPSTVMANGGKKRSSNLDVGTSNNYVIINN